MEPLILYFPDKRYDEADPSADRFFDTISQTRQRFGSTTIWLCSGGKRSAEDIVAVIEERLSSNKHDSIVAIACKDGFQRFMDIVPALRERNIDLPNLILIDPVTILSVEANDSATPPVFPTAYTITVKTPMDEIPVEAKDRLHVSVPVRGQREALVCAMGTMYLHGAWPKREPMDMTRRVATRKAPAVR